VLHKLNIRAKFKATHGNLMNLLDLAKSNSLFIWRVADGWCWFILREKYYWLVGGGWFVVREKYCWLVADKPCEQGVIEPIISPKLDLSLPWLMI
jgi:hypothetical protein